MEIGRVKYRLRRFSLALAATTGLFVALSALIFAMFWVSYQCANLLARFSGARDDWIGPCFGVCCFSIFAIIIAIVYAVEE